MRWVGPRPSNALFVTLLLLGACTGDEPRGAGPEPALGVRRSALVINPDAGSCQAGCESGQHLDGAGGYCYCDSKCYAIGDCCSDYLALCTEFDPAAASCQAGCEAGLLRDADGDYCYCDSFCPTAGDCCADYFDLCPHVDPEAGSCLAGCDSGRHVDDDGYGHCYCDAACTTYSDCCADYAELCPRWCAESVALEHPHLVESRQHLIRVDSIGQGDDVICPDGVCDAASIGDGVADTIQRFETPHEGRYRLTLGHEQAQDSWVYVVGGCGSTADPDRVLGAVDGRRYAFNTGQGTFEPLYYDLPEGLTLYIVVESNADLADNIQLSLHFVGPCRADGCPCDDGVECPCNLDMDCGPASACNQPTCLAGYCADVRDICGSGCEQEEFVFDAVTPADAGSAYRAPGRPTDVHPVRLAFALNYTDEVRNLTDVDWDAIGQAADFLSFTMDTAAYLKRHDDPDTVTGFDRAAAIGFSIYHAARAMAYTPQSLYIEGGLPEHGGMTLDELGRGRMQGARNFNSLFTMEDPSGWAMRVDEANGRPGLLVVEQDLVEALLDRWKPFDRYLYSAIPFEVRPFSDLFGAATPQYQVARDCKEIQVGVGYLDGFARPVRRVGMSPDDPERLNIDRLKGTGDDLFRRTTAVISRESPVHQDSLCRAQHFWCGFVDQSLYNQTCTPGNQPGEDSCDGAGPWECVGTNSFGWGDRCLYPCQDQAGCDGFDVPFTCVAGYCERTEALRLSNTATNGEWAIDYTGYYRDYDELGFVIGCADGPGDGWVAPNVGDGWDVPTPVLVEAGGDNFDPWTDAIDGIAEVTTDLQCPAGQAPHLKLFADQYWRSEMQLAAEEVACFRWDPGRPAAVDVLAGAIEAASTLTSAAAVVSDDYGGVAYTGGSEFVYVPGQVLPVPPGKDQTTHRTVMIPWFGDGERSPENRRWLIGHANYDTATVHYHPDYDDLPAADAAAAYDASMLAATRRVRRQLHCGADVTWMPNINAMIATINRSTADIRERIALALDTVGGALWDEKWSSVAQISPDNPDKRASAYVRLATAYEMSRRGIPAILDTYHYAYNGYVFERGDERKPNYAPVETALVAYLLVQERGTLLLRPWRRGQRQRGGEGQGIQLEHSVNDYTDPDTLRTILYDPNAAPARWLRQLLDISPGPDRTGAPGVLDADCAADAAGACMDGNPGDRQVMYRLFDHALVAWNTRATPIAVTLPRADWCADGACDPDADYYYFVMEPFPARTSAGRDYHLDLLHCPLGSRFVLGRADACQDGAQPDFCFSNQETRTLYDNCPEPGAEDQDPCADPNLAPCVPVVTAIAIPPLTTIRLDPGQAAIFARRDAYAQAAFDAAEHITLDDCRAVDPPRACSNLFLVDRNAAGEPILPETGVVIDEIADPQAFTRSRRHPEFLHALYDLPADVLPPAP